MTRKPRRGTTTVAFTLALGLACPAARAQDVAGGEALFQAGRQLMDAGHYPEACAKLAESVRLDPGGSGAHSLLGLCYEHVGKIASAWAEYEAARAIARRENRPDRERFANEHVAQLAPKLSFLTINIDPSAATTPGLEVRRDGEPFGRGAWGVRLPVDPGGHEVSASAPGFRPWHRTVVVGGTGQALELTVTPLQADENAHALPSAAPPAGASPESDTRARRTAAYVVGAAAVVALGVGAYFGVRALADHHDVNDRCPGGYCADHDPDAQSVADRSRREAWGADFGLALGALGLGAGTYLFLTSSSPQSPSTGSLRLAPVLAPGVAALTSGGVF